VLLNGHRMVLNPFAIAAAGAVDTNTIPTAAIGRIEVLKEGAAATYGSDAIGGVVNFITRQNLNGFEAGADYRAIDGSDGDRAGSLLWGWNQHHMHALISVSGQHRSALPTTERDWATLPYIENPQGGWSAAGSPNVFIPLGASTTRFRDPGCSTLGGTPGLTGAPPSVTPVCYWQYSKFDNLVENENRYQVFGNFDVDLTDTTKFHIDLLKAQTISGYNTSPSYALLQTPTALDGGVAGQFFVPVTNPGLAAFIAGNPGGITSANGVVSATGAPTAIPIAAVGTVGDLYIAGRPFALGGNPLYGHGPVQATRKFN
jgi:iron complex outermembrane receptor protein